jgi:branched-chain amino acid aminotransferase
MKKYCFINGSITTIDKAKINVCDIGLLRGYGVFDYLRSYNGKSFLVQEHLNRFKKSAALLNIRIPFSEKKIENIINKLLVKNKIKNAGIRLVLTGGKSEDGINYNIDFPTFFILIDDIHSYPQSVYKKGVALITFEHQREKPDAKSNNYITMVGLKALKKRKKAFEVLYTSNDKILEGTTCNFFIFKGDTLITSKDNILHGTRRNLTLRLAKGKFKIEERPVSLNELRKAKEAFITSTSRDIIPVVKVDNLKIGNGMVGKNTKFIMRLFQNFVSQEISKNK